MGQPYNSGHQAAQIVEYRGKVVDALKMRKDGYTLVEIANALGWNSPQAVSVAIRTTLDRTTHESVDELRQVVGERYDALIRQYLPLAIGGDVDAAHVVLKTEAQRAKLFGLDAPVRAEITGPGGGPVEVVEVDDLVSRIIAWPAIAGPVEGAAIGDAASDATGDPGEA